MKNSVELSEHTNFIAYPIEGREVFLVLVALARRDEILAIASGFASDIASC